MPTLDFVIQCRRAIVDKYGSGLTLVEVTESATVPAEKLAEFKAAPKGTAASMQMDFFVVTSWSRDKFDTPEDGGSTLIEPVAPDGWRGEPLELEVDLRRGRRMRNLFHVQALPFHGLGEYRFEVFWRPRGSKKKKLAGAVRFEVTEEPGETQTAPNPS